MGGTLAHTPPGAVPGGALVAPERATPLPLAVYQVAERVHSHVRELARVTAAAVTAVSDSTDAIILQTRARSLTDALSARAASVGVDVNTLIEIAMDQMAPQPKAEVWFV